MKEKDVLVEKLQDNKQMLEEKSRTIEQIGDQILK
jgi:hypothetical protein